MPRNDKCVLLAHSACPSLDVEPWGWSLWFLRVSGWWRSCGPECHQSLVRWKRSTTWPQSDICHFTSWFLGQKLIRSSPILRVRKEVHYSPEGKKESQNIREPWAALVTRLSVLADHLHRMSWGSNEPSMGKDFANCKKKKKKLQNVSYSNIIKNTSIEELESRIWHSRLDVLY